MLKLAVSLGLAANVAATVIFEDSVSSGNADFSVMSINKQFQWSECSTKTFATVFDASTYGTDTDNVAKFCALYCRNFVDDDTTHVNLDDRTDMGGAYACYCSSDCNSMCEGTPSYEEVSYTVSTAEYEAIAYYYNTYYYSSYWQYPYNDDSQFGRPMYYSYTGPSSGYNHYWYYYFGTSEGSNSYTLNGNDYVAYFETSSGSETTESMFVWTMDCDDGEDMDFINDSLDDLTASYNIVNGDDDTDFSTLSFTEALALNEELTASPKCIPVRLFRYGTISHGYTWPNMLDYGTDPSYVYGIDSDITNGVTGICSMFTDKESCEGHKQYYYGGYTCATDDTDAYTTSENFGYSYYYDGTSIYHGDSSYCFEFDWQLQDQGMYDTTFTYYYYYYYSYVYPCDWSYDYDAGDVDTAIHNMIFADYSLYAILE